MSQALTRTSGEYGAPSQPAKPATLRAYLRLPGNSQRRLARQARVNQSHISMIASGQRVPSAKLALKLHAITGVPLDALLRPRKRRRRAATTEMHMHV